MLKYSNIKWTDRDEKELNKTIRQFNNKIKKLERQNVDIIPFLPTKIKKSDIKREVKTRADFKQK